MRASFYNSNVVTLVPKFPIADRVENFRPIALANFQFWIITKILENKLPSLLQRLSLRISVVSLKEGRSLIASTLLLKGESSQ